MAEQAWEQEQETAGPIAVEVRKERWMRGRGLS